jgi:hypothetical protein
MFSRIVHIVAIIIAATAEISLSLWLGEAMPGLVFATILALSLGGDVIDSLWWVGLGGLLLDSMNGIAFGLYLLTFSLLSVALITLNRQVLHKPPFGIALIVFFIATAIWQAIFALLYSHLSWSMVISAGLTTLLATVLYRMVVLVGKRREVISLG